MNYGDGNRLRYDLFGFRMWKYGIMASVHTSVIYRMGVGATHLLAMPPERHGRSSTANELKSNIEWMNDECAAHAASNSPIPVSSNPYECRAIIFVIIYKIVRRKYMHNYICGNIVCTKKQTNNELWTNEKWAQLNFIVIGPVAGGWMEPWTASIIVSVDKRERSNGIVRLLVCLTEPEILFFHFFSVAAIIDIDDRCYIDIGSSFWFGAFVNVFFYQILMRRCEWNFQFILY